MFEAATLVGNYTGARMSKLKLDDTQSKAVYPKDVRYLETVDELLALSAMPLGNVTGISLKKHNGDRSEALRTLADIERSRGIMRLYEFLRFSTPDLVPTLVHEAAHFTDLYGGDTSGYKSIEARNLLRNKTYKFLAQCVESGIFIDEYHESLYNELSSCEVGSCDYQIKYKKLLNETRAILMESVFVDGARVQRLAREQFAVLSRKGFLSDCLVNPYRLGLLCFATLHNFSDNVRVLQHELIQRKRMMDEVVERMSRNAPRKVYLH